jgi:transcriptional regulator with XRE-family HTH domain
MQYGKALSEGRRRSGLTKRALAELAEVDESYISHVEAGRRDPSGALLATFAKVLRIPLPVFLLLGAEADDLRGLSVAEAKKLASHLVELTQQLQPEASRGTQVDAKAGKRASTAARRAPSSRKRS